MHLLNKIRKFSQNFSEHRSGETWVDPSRWDPRFGPQTGVGPGYRSRFRALPGDPLGRKPGERLWPEWFIAERVETAKREPRAWNALYQQRPVVEEGDYFKLDWSRHLFICQKM